ncbi:hypothetical protein SBI_07630 [Streptomyces bingchenggensis BCW-1]|uniref:Uncharacterized protein n=1 Tax=Streptomyces bingchenggensis (strain BCW-1) TaxID=749414 RepID=D7CB67_STRBB|nr:hypothetical protein SBI_07630 [Streptomyces bingchenggensis BCW-1]
MAVRIWDRTTGECTSLARAEGPMHSCAWSGIGHSLAVGGNRGLYLYQLHT